jgi:ABC-type polysaccharide/polyol phosphate export permease
MFVQTAYSVMLISDEQMKTLTAAWNRLIAEPIALVMAIIAVGFTIALCSFGVRVRDRLLFAVLAAASAVSAWLMARGGRW